MPPRPHILVVNSRKVQQPVFVIAAPHSGAGLLGRAIKQSPGFHLTIGQEAVQSVIYAFARSPSIQRGRREAAATMLRDAFARAWQVTAHSCLTCSPVCRDAAGVDGASACVAERDIKRYGDASPDLVYCADAIIGAFADARLIQIVRDGRDAVAAMLSDTAVLGWFSPSLANVETEFPNPFFGIETDEDLAAWPGLSAAGKCAMRWRGCVHAMTTLRTALSAEQLTTFRYEDLISQPAAIASAISEFVGAAVSPAALQSGHQPGLQALEPGAWRHQLTAEQVGEIESVAGPDLRRVGYMG